MTTYTSIGWIAWDSTRNVPVDRPHGGKIPQRPKVYPTLRKALRYGHGDGAMEVFVKISPSVEDMGGAYGVTPRSVHLAGPEDGRPVKKPW